jgi:hypothetical protein
MCCCIFFSHGKGNVTESKKGGAKQFDSGVNLALVQLSPLSIRAGVSCVISDIQNSSKYPFIDNHSQGICGANVGAAREFVPNIADDRFDIERNVPAC